MADRYFVPGGTGNWNSTTNWSATSGGSSGASVPVAGDDVYLDGNSGTGTLTVNVASACRSFICTGSANGFTLGAVLTVTGHFRLGSGMAAPAVSGTPGMTLAATTDNGGAGWDFDLAGKTIPFTTTAHIVDLACGADAGRYDLRSAMNLGAALLRRTRGKFYTNDYAVTCGQTTSSTSNAKAGDWGTSLVTCTSTNTGPSLGGTNDTTDISNAIFDIRATANPPNWGGLRVGEVRITNPNMVLVSGSVAGIGTLSHNVSAGLLNGVRFAGNGQIDTVTITAPSTRAHAVLLAANAVGTKQAWTFGACTFTGNVNFRDLAILDKDGDAVTVSDSFDRADGPLGSTDSYAGGSTQTWTAASGSWDVLSNTARGAGGAGTHFVTVPAAQNVQVQATLVGTPVAGIGVVARHTDADNYIRAYVDPSRDVYVSVRAGGVQVMSNTLAVRLNAGETFALKVQNDAIAVSRSGVVAWSAIPSTLPTGTAAGLSALATAQIDSFQVRPLSDKDLSARDDIGDELGNTGVTFPASVHLTRDSGSGLWEDTARWQIHTGGGTARIPLPQDDLTLTASSGTITGSSGVNAPLRMCRNLDMSGYTAAGINLTSSANDYQIFGDITLPTGPSPWATIANTIYMQTRKRGTCQITSNGKTFFPATSNNRLTIAQVGGICELVDDFIGRCTAAGTFGLIVSDGRLKAPGRIVTTGTLSLNSTAARGIEDCAGTEFRCEASGGSTVFDGGSVTNLAGTLLDAKIVVVNASASTRTFTVPQGFHVGEVTHTSTTPGSTNGPVRISGTGEIKRLTIRRGNTVSFTVAVSPAIRELVVSGGTGTVTVNSATGGTKAHVQFTGPPQNLEDCAFTDIISALPDKIGLGSGCTQSNCENLTAGTVDTTKPYISCVSQASIAAIPLVKPFDAGNVIVLWQSASAYGPPAGYTELDQTGSSPSARSYWALAAGGERTLTTTSTSVGSVVVEIGNAGNSPTFVNAENTGTSITALDAGNGGPTGETDDLALDFVGASNTMGAHVSVTGGFQLIGTATGVSTGALVRATAKRLTGAGAVTSTLTWTTSRNGVGQRILIRRLAAMTFTPSLISETDTARQPATRKRSSPGIGTETSSARAVTYRKSSAPALVVETNTSRPSRQAKQAGPVLVVEAATVFAARNTKRRAPTVVIETDTALAVAISGPEPGNRPGRFGPAPIGHLVTASPGRTIGVQIGHLED